MNWNLPGNAYVKGEMELAGNDLYDFQFFRLTDLVRRKIKRALSWPHATEFNFSVDLRWLQVSHHTRRTAHPDLRPRHRFGIDFQVSRNVMKFNGNI